MIPMNAIYTRHSVRSYLPKPIEEEKLIVLRSFAEDFNREHDLHIQLVTDEPKAFSSFLSHYGLFDNVSNYIALVGRNRDGLKEACGYCGEQLVLIAQTLKLNTCWVALTYKKIPGAFEVNADESLVCVIALGYGKTQGKPHRSKSVKDVVEAGEHPDWFIRGVESALLAPTAVNQQKFRFLREGSCVKAVCGRGAYTEVDLGIVKYHFEIGANKENFEWM